MPELSSSNMQARDKLTFLLSLVPFLIDRGRVSVAETADHFGVSEEFVRQSVRLIAVSGIPGVTASYQPDDLFDIAWDEFEDEDQIVLTNLIAIDDSPRFSGREAAALIAGLQYLSGLPEFEGSELVPSLLLKLARATSGSPSQVAVATDVASEPISQFRQAVEQGFQVEFDYLNAKGELERRRVDPLRVDSVDNDWYLRGWCHLREALRTFRIDRIRNIAVTGEPLIYHSEDVELPESLFESSPDDIPVRVEIKAPGLQLVSDYLSSPVVQEGSDGQLLLGEIRVSHFHGLKRLACARSEYLRIIAPNDAIKAVVDWAEAGLASYQGSQ